MIEEKILKLVAEALQVPVHMEIPADRPSSFVVLKRSGEGRKNLVEDSMLIADSYAESLYEAAKLNKQVKSVLDDLVDTLDDICSVQLSADYPVTDTGSKQHRYQAVYKISHY